MRFNSSLTEAILLKRSIKFLAEVVLANGQKLMIRCPNLNPMIGCDILGTKLWYSTAVGYHCLPTWELAEVDGGNLVCINPELMKSLVIEGIKKGVVEEFLSYNVLPTNNTYEQTSQQSLLLEQDRQNCYVYFEQVTLGNDQGEGFFPERQGLGSSKINKLIDLCRAGKQAVLFFCVTHTGINHIKPAYHIDPRCGQLLQTAMAAGVQLLAYKADISLQGIELATKLPILFAEDAIYREH